MAFVGAEKFSESDITLHDDVKYLNISLLASQRKKERTKERKKESNFHTTCLPAQGIQAARLYRPLIAAASCLHCHMIGHSNVTSLCHAHPGNPPSHQTYPVPCDPGLA